MTRLEAIRELLNQAYYASEPCVLWRIRRILNGEDPSSEVLNFKEEEEEAREAYSYTMALKHSARN